MSTKFYQITFYVPKEHCEAVKNAMFKVGAGELENYACCSWQVLGKGQFKPMEGSNPFIGTKDKIEKVLEYKVEMLCTKERLSQAIEALKEAHPYEVPAYVVVALVNI